MIRRKGAVAVLVGTANPEKAVSSLPQRDTYSARVKVVVKVLDFVQCGWVLGSRE